MLFTKAVAAASLLVSVVAATDTMIPDFSVPASSAMGRKLLEKAEGGRALEQAEDAGWLYQYNLKYQSCSSLVQVREEGGGEDEGLLYTQNLVKFSLCSATDCSSCQADYVVNMMDFVDAYTESKMNEQEYACEQVRENCYNDDEYSCYMNAGMDYCIDNENEEEFQIQEYLECKELENENGDNNNNNGNNYNYGNNNNNNNNGVDIYRQYYVGMACSEKDGKTINLKVFYDAGCSQKAGSGVYEALNYGTSLPYEYESLVQLDDCMSCLQVDEDNNNNNNNNNGDNNNGNNNNNNNNNGNYEITEICQQSYEMAAKCEEKLDMGNYFYPDTTGCNYINSILPRLEKATRKISSSSTTSTNGASTAFAIIFFLTSCVLGAYAFFLYRKIHRAKVNLAQSEGMTMA